MEWGGFYSWLFHLYVVQSLLGKIPYFFRGFQNQILRNRFPHLVIERFRTVGKLESRAKAIVYFSSSLAEIHMKKCTESLNFLRESMKEWNPEKKQNEILSLPHEQESILATPFQEKIEYTYSRFSGVSSSPSSGKNPSCWSRTISRYVSDDFISSAWFPQAMIFPLSRR